MRTPVLPILLAAPLLCAFALESVSSAPPSPEGNDPFAVATSRTFERTLEFDGVFVPADAEELLIWPEASSGELLLLEVLPHGSYVSAGEVVARLDTRPLSEQLESAERGLHSAEIAHEGTVVRAELAAASDAESLERSKAELERARRSFEGYLERELDFQRRTTEAGLRSFEHNVADQQDELEQLEEMYREDELFQATEEIVLRRNRRNLHESERMLALQKERTEHDRELNVPMAIERRREQLAQQESAHRRLVRTKKLDAASREDGVKVSAAGLDEKRRRLERLRHDLELLVIRSPRAGILLHGSLRDHGPGRVRPDRHRGDRLTPRAAFACVADPERLAFAFSVDESQVGEAKSGMAADVVPVVSEKAGLVGAISVKRYPTPSSASGPKNLYEARVDIDGFRPGILVGTRGKASVELEKIPDAIVVPSTAVFGEGEEAHCWASKSEGAPFERVSVEVGPSEGGDVVIAKGVDAGWRVLLAQPGS